MVSEEASMIRSGVRASENWLSASDKALADAERASDVESFVGELVREICERVAMPRDRQIRADERSLKKHNRRTAVVDSELFEAAKDLVDENDNSVVEAVNPALERKSSKRRKTLSFSFLKKLKDDKKKEDGDHPESYDHFDPHPQYSTLRAGKKYSSALELNQKPTKLTRTSSLFRKIGEESKNFLKRSMSVRELGKRRDRSREKLSEEKELEWKQSLQSLVENDSSVSYNDLSFVDYDVMNDIRYDEGFFLPEKSCIARTQKVAGVPPPHLLPRHLCRQPGFRRKIMPV